MAKQLVNVGTSVNKGDGDPLRTAFQKINDNFNELYASTSLDLDSIGSNMIPTSDGGFALGSATKQWSDLYVRDFIYIGGTRLQSDAQGNITVDGGSLQIKDVQGDIFADDSTKVFDSATQTFTGKFEGEFNGTIAADDSTVLIDGVAGTINASALTGALPAIDGSALTGVSASSIAFSNVTSTPTTIAGYGIADAYTKTEVDNAISSSVLPAGSTQSIDVVAQDSTVLVDSVNGTLNATTLTGALPAIDGSSLTGVTTAFSNITSTPTTLAGYGITDAYTKAEVDSSIADVTAGHFDFNITGDDSTVRTVAKGDTIQIVGGTGITTASDADGNITITGFDGAFASLTSKPTTISGYGITDALTAGGALTGSSLEAVAVGAGVADGNDLTITGGDATELNSTGGDTNITGGSGALASGNVNIGASQTALVTIGSGSNNVDFPNGTAVDFTGATVTGLPAAYSDSDVDAHLNQSTASTNEVLSWDGADYAWVAQSGGGSGLQSRSTATGTTTSLADAAEADLDITGFKSYALLTITTDRAARVRLYVSAATRTADASRAEGVDPTSDAGLIAEVITTGAETVIISPGAYGFNLESSPTTTIPCRVTNKSGGTSTVQVDLNILQLEA